MIRESREITGKLSRIFNDENSTNILKEYNNIDNAFDMAGGEWQGMQNLALQAKKKLETVNGKLSGINVKEERNSHNEKDVGKLEKIIGNVNNIINDLIKKF